MNGGGAPKPPQAPSPRAPRERAEAIGGFEEALCGASSGNKVPTPYPLPELPLQEGPEGRKEHGVGKISERARHVGQIADAIRIHRTQERGAPTWLPSSSSKQKEEERSER